MDVARTFSVPPTVVGITDNATYSNVDGESRALVVRCLAPMARRVEQAMNVALLTAEGRKRYFVEHDLAGLMRGDMKARYEAYRIGREWGWLSPNDIRAWENLKGIEGGEEYLSPLNMEERQIADLLGQKTPSMARHYSRSANLADRNRITMETLELENERRSQVVKPISKIVKPGEA
ncbi:phage portal protein [Phaeobacter sp. B1627]|uniref:phage portal protein n=1 Tax=Phaeobacter sp. B1627 TaxID=2583809 RepID=UPI002105B793|nr:phage portal protein [Phaeobacter sp. B1627]